jgi:S-adenosylmethionine:tRNA ribosyltransferase-isomerase
MNSYALSDYSYTLPEGLIAQEAIHPHHNARMMVIDRSTGILEQECLFRDLQDILTEDDVLFFNNSRVVRSRIPLKKTPYKTKFGHEWIIEDGEIFFLKNSGNGEFEALVRPGNKFKEWTQIHLHDEALLTVLGTTSSGRRLRLERGNIYELLEKHGQLPLPPYIEYDAKKESDYQTSFATKDGSVAAPTASLHFTQALIESLSAQKEYVTLHVGLGTFKGIDTTDVREYAIHEETIEVQKNLFTKIANIKEQEKSIIAVGTTVCRTLESLPYIWRALEEGDKQTYSPQVREFWNAKIAHLPEGNILSNHTITSDAIICGTRIYITPGYEFLVIDDLITNFHLPESSLLVLVSAFLWYLPTMKIYQYAIENAYRFFSFWDGMYIRKPRKALQVPHQ